MSTTETKTALRNEGEPLEQLQPPSRDRLEQQRAKAPIVRGPSGASYRLRKVNLERHALGGGLPVKLRRAAMEGVKGLERILGDEETDGTGTTETRQYLDELVLATIVEPQLTKDDLGTGQLDDDPLLPAQDYAWAVKVAMGEEEYDADGRRLWGIEPLDRFATFRAFHGCDENCEGCDGFRHAVSSFVERGRAAG